MRNTDTEPDTEYITVTVTERNAVTVTIAELCAGNGAYRGRHVRGRKPVAVMDHANVDELRFA